MTTSHSSIATGMDREYVGKSVGMEGLDQKAVRKRTVEKMWLTYWSTVRVSDRSGLLRLFGKFVIADMHSIMISGYEDCHGIGRSYWACCHLHPASLASRQCSLIYPRTGRHYLRLSSHPAQDHGCWQSLCHGVGLVRRQRAWPPMLVRRNCLDWFHVRRCQWLIMLVHSLDFQRARKMTYIWTAPMLCWSPPSLGMKESTSNQSL